ncbi:MAG: c(7)-type cytochrome triheme domain-containing protein [Nitrospirota bacterium]
MITFKNRFFSIVFAVVIIFAINSCATQKDAKAPAAKETKKEAAPKTEPAKVVEAAKPAEPAPAKKEEPAAKPSTKAAEKAPAAKAPQIDPSQAIFLDSTGTVAGTGDPTKVVGAAEKAGMAPHPMALELAKLPKDKYGLIDWAAIVKEGKIKPWHSLDPNAPPDMTFPLEVVIKTKSMSMEDVVFPHFIHTFWLNCTNCHPAIFNMKAGGNPDMTMAKIAAGQYCGRCHDRVAFPLTDCQRCHVRPKGAK